MNFRYDERQQIDDDHVDKPRQKPEGEDIYRDKEDFEYGSHDEHEKRKDQSGKKYSLPTAGYYNPRQDLAGEPQGKYAKQKHPDEMFHDRLQWYHLAIGRVKPFDFVQGVPLRETRGFEADGGSEARIGGIRRGYAATDGVLYER